jgi:hypothetical protein
LKGVARRFTNHVMPGETVQLVVHQRNEFFQRLLVPHAPSLEQQGYFVSGNNRQTVLSICGTEANYIPISEPA